jgi:metallophosphoesterase superfamily enzyme
VTAAVLGDLHFPHQDERAIALALNVIYELQPEEVFLNGDIMDMHQISRWGCSPERKLTLQQDLDRTRRFLVELRSAAPEAFIHYLEGNHEARLGRYLQERPEIHGLAALQLPALLGLEGLQIGYTTVPYLEFGGWVVTHGDRVSSRAGATAQKMIDAYGTSGINNHVHRLAQVTRRQAMREMTWIENGCLCDLYPEYTAVADWKQGFTVLHWDGAQVWPEVVAIHAGKALYRGEYLEVD